LNLARARCDAFSPLLTLNEVENVFLTTSQHGFMIAELADRASSNEQIRICCI
jgi:hypothetical protein